MNSATPKHSLTLTCASCSRMETFSGERRSDVVIALDRSTWRTRPTENGDSAIATCGVCTGSGTTHAEHAAEVFAA